MPVDEKDGSKKDRKNLERALTGVTGYSGGQMHEDLVHGAPCMVLPILEELERRNRIMRLEI